MYSAPSERAKGLKGRTRLPKPENRHEEAVPMKLARVLGIAAFVVAVGFFSGAAYADSIGPDCGSCFGGIFSLSYIPPDDGHVTIIYKADLSNSTITDIDVIGFKVVSGGNTNNLTGVTFGSGPAAWGTDAQLAKTLSNNGCTTPGDDFVCSQ